MTNVEKGYIHDSTEYHRLWLLWQFFLEIQPAVRTSITLHVADRPCGPLIPACDGIWMCGRAKAPCPRVLSRADGP